jgi:hypothetical protein
MNGWDKFMDQLSAMPEWAQYAAQRKMQDMVRTAEQLAKLGVPYPHDETKSPYGWYSTPKPGADHE